MKLKDINISMLKGVTLDYAVAKAMKLNAVGVFINFAGERWCCINKGTLRQRDYSPTTQWEQCGELLDEFELEVTYFEDDKEYAARHHASLDDFSTGSSYKEAICRWVVWWCGAYDLEIPDELLKE